MALVLDAAVAAGIAIGLVLPGERRLDLRGREQLRVAIGGGVSESRTWRNDGTPSTATTGSSVVSYQYEPGMGRLAALVEGNARADLSYDGDGRVARLALTNGVERTLGYDAAGRMTAVTESQGSLSAAWSGTYDATDGRLRMVRDPLGTQRFAYDAAGRTVSDAYDGPGGWSLLFGYDGNGNRISETGSLAPIVSGAGDLATAFQPVRGTWLVAGAPLTAQVPVPVDGTTAHGWLAIGHPLLLTARVQPGQAGLRGLVVAHSAQGILVAGVRATATGVVPTLWSDPADGAAPSTTIAEAAEQAVGDDGWVALQVAQTPSGVLLAVDGTAALTASSGWALTGPGLLAQGGDPTAVFAEVSWLVGGTAIARASTYDASDRLLTRQTETGTETWSYGQPGIAPTVRTLVRADGSRQVTTQITDALDRIASLDRQEFDAQGLASPASQWSWTYAGGLRQAQTLSGPEGTTSFAYAGDRLVSATPPGAPTVTYTHGLGSLPLWERSGGSLTVIGRDIRGLVSARYGAAAPTENWRYTAYGDARAVGTDGTATTPTAGGLRYHGQWQVPGLHGYQMGARFYDTDLGRFATEDPARAGTNGYAYCGGDPVNRSDPSGLDWIESDGGLVYWVFDDPSGNVLGRAPIATSSDGITANFSHSRINLDGHNNFNIQGLSAMARDVHLAYEQFPAAAVQQSIRQMASGTFYQGGFGGNVEEARSTWLNSRIVAADGLTFGLIDALHADANKVIAAKAQEGGWNGFVWGASRGLGNVSGAAGATAIVLATGGAALEALPATTLLLNAPTVTTALAWTGSAAGLGFAAKSGYDTVESFANGDSAGAGQNLVTTLALLPAAKPGLVLAGRGANFAGGYVADAYRGMRLGQVVSRQVATVDAAIASGDIGNIMALGVSRNMAARLVGGGAARFRGSLIDKLSKAQAAQTWGLRSLNMPGNFQYGPDFWNPATRRAWDMTTPGQWAAHVDQYLLNPPLGKPTWNSLDPLFTTP